MLEDIKSAKSALTRADSIAKGTLAEVRQLARALSPSAFGQRLNSETIARMADSFTAAGLKMTTSITGDTALLSETEQTLLFRALQETLTNAVRHAHATNVHISLTVGVNSTRLTVEDDGPGMDEADADHGFGLAALRRRFEEAGGSMTVGESQTLGGTDITLVAPRASCRSAQPQPFRTAPSAKP